MPLLNRIRNSRILNRRINAKTNALKQALKTANSTYNPLNTNKYSNVRLKAVAFIGSNGRVGTFNTYEKIIKTLGNVKKKRQNALNNKEKQQKIAKKLETLNIIDQKNLNTLGLKRNAGAIQYRFRMYQNKFPNNFNTYPDMIKYLLGKQNEHQKKANEKKRRNENRIQNILKGLSVNERHFFNVISRTKPYNNSIPAMYYSAYRNGVNGYVGGSQTEPLKGLNLAKYRVGLAQKLANERRRSDTTPPTN